MVHSTIVLPANGQTLQSLATANFQPVASTRQFTEWDFGRDLAAFGITAPTNVTTADGVAPVAAALDGPGWAFTQSFGSAGLCFNCTAPPPPNPNLSNNYFQQDLNPRPTATAAVGLPPLLLPWPWPVFDGGPRPFRDPISWAFEPTPGVTLFTIQDRLVSPLTVDFGAAFDGLVGRLGTDVRYFQAAEPVAFLDTVGLASRGVFVENATAPVHVLKAQVSGLVTVDTAAQLFTATAGTFSALNDDLYFVENGGSGLTFIRYNVDQNVLTQNGLELSADLVPRALAYRIQDDSLYLLARTAETGGNLLTIARFSRTGSGAPPLLVEVLDAAAHSGLFLTTTYSGQLLLSASGATTDSTFYMVLDPKSDHIDVASAFSDPTPGALVLPPNSLLPNRYSVALQSGSSTAVTFDDVFPGNFISVEEPLGGALSDFSTAADRGNTSGLASSPWPMQGGCPTHQGRVTVTGPQTNATRWKLATTNLLEIGPAVGADGTVFLPSDSKLLSISPAGAVNWTFSAPLLVRTTPAVGQDGSVYFGADDGSVYALNSGGTQRWRVATQLPVRSSPVVAADGTVFIGSDSGQLWALDGPTGTVKWRATAGGLIHSSPALAPDGRSVCVGSDDLHLYCFDVTSGSLIWKLLLNGLVESSPAFGADGTIYVGTLTNSLYAVNPTGTQKWIFQTLLPVRSSPALGADGTVYFGSDDGRVYAVTDRGTSAQLLWSYKTGAAVSASPLVGDDGTIYIGSGNHKVYALLPGASVTSRVLWSKDLGSEVEATAAIGPDGTLYVPAEQKQLFAIGP